jgi:hypothetical protein
LLLVVLQHPVVEAARAGVQGQALGLWDLSPAGCEPGRVARGRPVVSAQIRPGVLSRIDIHYLRLDMERFEGAPAHDPQAGLVYLLEDHGVHMECPAWTRRQVVTKLRRLARRHGLRIRLEWTEELGAEASPDSAGGTIFLNRKRVWGMYRPLGPNEYLSSIALHEFAHLLVRQSIPWDALYWGPEYQSHGPEFVECYFRLLDDVMDTRRSRKMATWLGVRGASRPVLQTGLLPFEPTGGAS